LLKIFCQLNERAWLYAARFISLLPAVIVPSSAFQGLYCYVGDLFDGTLYFYIAVSYMLSILVTSVRYKRLSSDTAAILNMNLSAGFFG
jgi:hypothetical protein